MKTPALLLGFIVAYAAAVSGCGDNEVPPQGAKELVSFGFRAADNPSLTADVSATINGNAISATVPFGTDPRALIATFETTGTSVTVGGMAQVSGTTANNFAANVNYQVTAEDSTTRNYTVMVKIAPSNAKQLTAYAFLAAKNAGLGADVTATINGTTIMATVPFGTSLAGLVATFATTGASVTVAGTAQVSGTTANNFTSPVTYRVTAADGSTQDYTVTVIAAPSNAKEITAYAFLSANNAGLGADVTATINGTTITATVPFGTSPTALVATFATTGASVTVAGTAQVSGTTANNFTSPVTYRVTAADGSTKDFTVTVNVAPSNAKEITAYAFLSANNAGLPADVTATINGTAIAATVPFGTNVTGLIATFATTGASVTVAGTAQVSGTTANNFTAPVAYTVTAADGSTKVFTVTVNVALNPAKEITTFAFLSVDNPGLPADVSATVTGTTITATVPFGTDRSGLIATFATTGASVTVAGTTQVSGITANNFTNPVIYRVTAADGSTKDFTVTVNEAPSPAKEITAYAFLSVNNPVLSADVTATINGTAITATVPFGTSRTALIATFSTSGANVSVAGTTQVSGITANDFTNPVIYHVTAADGSTKDFTVTVNVAPNTAKAITAYAFLSANNPVLSADIVATINGTAIVATVPFGTDPTGLVATFTTTGASVTVGSTPQVSGVTANDFTNPVAYTVTADDGSTAVFTVTVNVAPSDAKEITAYAFLSAHNPVLSADVTATINGTAIAATVPFGTDPTGLVATFATDGASVTVAGTPQVSGTTANDFTAPVLYRVTAADGSTKDFTVTVTVALNPAKEITAYAFLSVDNPGLAADVVATINGTAIAATVPFATDVNALIATFATSGASVAVAGIAQTSGITANNFTTPVVYTVTAADGSTKDFTVTVTVAANPAKEITAFAFESVHNPGLPADVTATINGTAITATVPFGTDRSALIATFSTTGASVTVAGTAQFSGITANNFSTPVIYHVTAADGSTKDFTVIIDVAPSPAKDITAYAFLSVDNPTLTANVTATITGTSIAATVPFGTDVRALIATFSTTGASVAVAGTPQFSGITANNFTAPVAYTVTAADTTTAVFTVTVTVAPAAKDITAYAFLAANNPVLTADVVATITGTSISATVPSGTNVTALVATFTTTGASVTVGGVTQVSGTTANTFAAPVVYRVTGADSLTKDFTVTVHVLPTVTAYSFQVAQNPGLAVASIGTITGTSIALAVQPGFNVTNMVATFTTSGTSVTVGGVTQTSAVTPNDFTNPVIYTVRAADGTTQTFTVTVTVLVTSFGFPSSVGSELTFPSDGVNPKLVAAPVMSRVGGTPIGAAGAFSGSGWNTTGLNIAHYYSFTVTPAAGSTMTLTNFALKNQRSGTGPLTFAVRSSLDNFAADIQTLATATALAANQFALGASFANLTTGVEFRIYAFGASASTGTWRIDDVQLAGVIVP